MSISLRVFHPMNFYFSSESLNQTHTHGSDLSLVGNEQAFDATLFVERNTDAMCQTKSKTGSKGKREEEKEREKQKKERGEQTEKSEAKRREAKRGEATHSAPSGIQKRFGIKRGALSALTLSLSLSLPLSLSPAGAKFDGRFIFSFRNDDVRETTPMLLKRLASPAN